MKDFSVALFVELWSYSDVLEDLKIVIKNYEVKYKITNGIYQYMTHNSYRYEIVLTVHFYNLEEEEKIKLQSALTFFKTFLMRMREISILVGIIGNAPTM